MNEKKDYKNEYLKISKFSVVAEISHKNAKTTSTSILIDDIIPDHQFWINTNNVFKNKYYQDSILSISIDLNSNNKILTIDKNQQKKEISPNELYEFYQDWLTNVELLINSSDLLIKENFKEKILNGNQLQNQLKLNDLMNITKIRDSKLLMNFDKNWDFTDVKNKNINHSK